MDLMKLKVRNSATLCINSAHLFVLDPLTQLRNVRNLLDGICFVGRDELKILGSHELFRVPQSSSQLKTVTARILAQAADVANLSSLLASLEKSLLEKPKVRCILLHVYKITDTCLRWMLVHRAIVR